MEFDPANFDPYAIGGGSGGEIATQQPAPRVPDGVPADTAIQQQLEINRRSLEYKSRFETDIPAPGTPSAPGDVNRGSGV
jgi:hypothetical protein